MPAISSVTSPALSALSAPRTATDVRRSSLEATLLRRLDAAATGPSMGTIAALRAAVTDLVDRLKPLGLSREDVVAAVAVLVHDHDRRGHTMSIGARLTAARETALREQVSAWCARAYAGDEWW